jgi:hypothetical protein
VSLAKALLAFQTDAPAIHKDATNNHFGNSYVTLGSLMDAVRPALTKQGLVLIQKPTQLENGQPGLLTKLVHADSGEEEQSVMPLLLDKSNPQGQGSALTYARGRRRWRSSVCRGRGR